jgi:hypothetical protein
VLAQLLSIKVVRGLVSGLLPGLVLRLLLLVMPAALAALVASSGTVVSRGDVDARVTTLFFVFQASV